MSRPYWRVSPAFWGDEKVGRWGDDSRLLALYLLTCQHRTLEGLFRLPKGYIMEDLGWDSKRLAKPFGELLREGFIDYDEDTKLCLIINALEYQAPENPNQITAAIKLLEALPESRLFARLFEQAERLCQPFAERLLERFPERLAKPLALALALAPTLAPTKPRDEAVENLVDLVVSEVPPSESTPEDYRRIIERYRGRLTDEHIQRVILNLADWRPKKPRAKLHLTLAKWLSGEPRDPIPPSHVPAELPQYDGTEIPMPDYVREAFAGIGRPI